MSLRKFSRFTILFGKAGSAAQCQLSLSGRPKAVGPSATEKLDTRASDRPNDR